MPCGRRRRERERESFAFIQLRVALKRESRGLPLAHAPCRAKQRASDVCMYVCMHVYVYMYMKMAGWRGARDIERYIHINTHTTVWILLAALSAGT